MNSLRIALLPGVIAGVISIFTSWFWVAVVFHKYQGNTPQIWRPETGRMHALSSVIQIAACIVLATFYVIAVKAGMGLFGDGLRGALWFAVLGWVAFVAPVLLNTGLYIKLDPLVTVGLLVNWLTTALLTTVITGWWIA